MKYTRIALVLVLLVLAVAGAMWLQSHGRAGVLEYVAGLAPILSGGSVHVAHTVRKDWLSARTFPLKTGDLNMDTVQQAVESLNSGIAVTTSHLNTIAQAATMVDGIAQQAAAAGSPAGAAVTPEQRVAAVAQVATALDPQIGQLVTPAATLVGAVHDLLSLFGLIHL